MFFVLALIGFSINSIAQKTTKIYGSVADASTNQPVLFANVVFQKSSVGILTDTAGNFVLETKRNFDSLTVSLLGYRSQTLAVNRGVTEEIEILLSS
jgi:hypothetical protein